MQIADGSRQPLTGGAGYDIEEIAGRIDLQGASHRAGMLRNDGQTVEVKASHSQP
jgi:hypothetical protein